MKTNWPVISGKIFVACLLSALAVEVRAAEQTAFALIKEGNRYVGEDCKDRVTQIRSEKSVSGLEPNIWFIVYYDPDARMKATEVKFGAGKKLDVKRPFRLFERAGDYKPMDRAKLKIDSDDALAIARKESLLDKLKLTNSRMTLEKWDDGLPVWKVRLWAEKLRDSTKTADIGEIFISAETGKVVHQDLHINRID